MFDSLTSKLQNAFRNLRGLGKISENNVAESLREVRMALLDADVNRPAATDQLATLGEKIDVPVFLRKGETDVLSIAREARDFAAGQQRNTLIFDTAGRLQIDQPLVQELVRLRDLVQPDEILLVLDAATGQEAVNVALHFDQALGMTGSILTKLDGDARGGAALSLRSVTGKP